MPLQHFTQRWVEGVKPPPTGKQIDYYDTLSLGKGRRFGLRVSYRGTKTWAVFYQYEGRTRRLSVGHWPPLGLAEARKKADKELSAILLDHDPAADRQADKHAETVGELAALYIDRYAKQHKRSWQRDQEMLARDVLPFWGRRKLKDIRRRDVCVMTDRIVDRGAPVGANRVFAVVSKMFNWAVERDLLEHNPCNGAKKPTTETARERTLSKAEIKTFWHGLAATNITAPMQLLLKLLLTLGQRKGELAQATKAEVDLDGAAWVIPSERAKNGRPHFVPLSPLAVALFRQAFELSGESEFIFPSPQGSKAVSSATVNMTVRRNWTTFGLTHWTPHDLRRTAATRMCEVGISGDIVDRILNHKIPGVRGVYDRYSYSSEKRAALQKWGRQLEAIVNGEVASVIAFR